VTGALVRLVVRISLTLLESIVYLLGGFIKATMATPAATAAPPVLYYFSYRQAQAILLEDCDPARRHVRFIFVSGKVRSVMGRNDTESEHGLVTETKKKVKRPPLYKVLLHNDDYTTKEFVVQILQYVFHKEQSEAMQIMLHVHKKALALPASIPMRSPKPRWNWSKTWRGNMNIR
jgi:ATP-dependent Clp protease adaptor protein ClpS